MSFPLQAQSDFLNKIILLQKDTYTVRELLEEVIPNQGIPISYSDNLIPDKKNIVFEVRRVALREILAKICYNENLSFESTRSRVLIKYYDRPGNQFYYTINGKVKEKGTNELLIGANLLVRGTSQGVITNGYGFYSLTLPKGQYELAVSFIGFEPILVQIDLSKHDLHYDFVIEPKSTKLEDVIVSSKKDSDLLLQNILSSTNQLDMTMAGEIPYFLGEVDVFQGSLLLPGIINIGEGASGINVRGGSSDQNLIVLDEALVYNSHHFFGLISIFNPDAINDVEILKGSFPAKYGGRVSSVMHVRHRDGNDQEFKLSGGIGFVTSRLLAEGPIKKGKSSFLISGRSTFWDLLIRNADNATLSDSRANFWDLNAKANFNINSKNKVYFSGYIGGDENKFGFDVRRKWGNRVFSFRWNRNSAKFFGNYTAYFSNYRYRVFDEEDRTSSVGSSQITDYAMKADLTYFFNPTNLLDFGGAVTYHKLLPGIRVPGDSSSNNVVRLPKENGIESALYIENERELTNRLTASIGVRVTSFLNIGPGDTFVYQRGLPRVRENIIDTLSAGDWDVIKSFVSIQPRISLKYEINKFSVLKANYSRTTQFLHLLSNTFSPSSSDIWKISGNYLEPTRINQITLGYYRHFDLAGFQASAELFYRGVENTIEYKDGADLLFNEAIETELINGTSRSFGFEVFLKKEIGALTGWIGYTLSRADRRVNGTFPDEKINDGGYFPSDFDRRHDLSISGIYKFKKRWTLSANFVYYTGRPFSFPDAKYTIDGIIVPQFSERNRQRLPSYHRLDFSARLEGKEFKKNGKKRSNSSYWVFSIYNIYSRRNAQAYFFRQNENDPTQSEVVRLSVLGSIVPSVTYNFKF